MESFHFHAFFHKIVKLVHPAFQIFNSNLELNLLKNVCNFKDGNAIQAVKRPVKSIDYGFVGDVVGISNDLFQMLLTLDPFLFIHVSHVLCFANEQIKMYITMISI